MDQKIQGCLLGSAVGDALGAPIEFLTADQIKSQVPDGGLTAPLLSANRQALISDDTQMTLFTAEALLADLRVDTPDDVLAFRDSCIHSYQRWLGTQGIETEGPVYEGLLWGTQDLHARRAPGETCVDVISTGEFGYPEDPKNDRKGSGGIMRVAPIAMVYPPEMAFDRAMFAAAITHGHPTGFLSAGAMAAILARIREDDVSFQIAATDTLEILAQCNAHEETSEAITKALQHAMYYPVPSPESIEKLGRGWVAEEALAIALYCAMTTMSTKNALLVSVQHGGDSDTTGALVGALTGAKYGVQSIPEEWLAVLELRNLIEHVANAIADGAPDKSNEGAMITHTKHWPS